MVITSNSGDAINLSQDLPHLEVTENIGHILRIKEPFAFEKRSLERLKRETQAGNFVRISLSSRGNLNNIQSLLGDGSTKVILLSWLKTTDWASRFLIIRRAGKSEGGEIHWERVGTMVLCVGSGSSNATELTETLGLRQLKYDILLS